jgi:hypothetical protein
VREILTHGSVRGSNAHPRNTHPKAQKQKCGHRAKVESKDCGLVLYSTTDRTGDTYILIYSKDEQVVSKVSVDGQL